MKFFASSNFPNYKDTPTLAIAVTLDDNVSEYKREMQYAKKVRPTLKMAKSSAK